MNFSTDRDLLVLEPNVFRDVPYLSQQRVQVTDGILSGAVLSSNTADFVSSQVDAGGVVIIGNVPHEVIERVDGHQLTVSLVRTSVEDPAILSQDGTSLKILVRTFQSQAALVHDALLRLIGIEPDDPANDLSEASIISHRVVSSLEALGTLERVYSGAVALSGDNSLIIAKATEYRRQFHSACREASILLDTDGDGYADVRRHLGVIWCCRV
jgi:hypothetical protein